MNQDATPTQGINLPRVRQWLNQRIDGPYPDFTVALISGGRSNLTYTVTSGDGAKWVLRRPPLGQILPTAHDMAREFRILSALQSTPVRVPKLVGLCEDASVTGAPFYVMQHVDGHIIRTGDQAESLLDEASRHRAGVELATALGEIHQVDPDEVGLGQLGRRADYVERQLGRWMRQYAATRTHDVPEVEKAHNLLFDAKPPQRRTGIVHGDYRLDNVVVGDAGEARAVLDWELCTLGDPLADVGQMLLRTLFPGQVEAGHLQPPLVEIPHYASAEEILEAYSRWSGADVSDADYYIALASWKSACILQGVYVRQRGGVMPGSASDEGILPDVIRQRASVALQTLHQGARK